MYRHRFDCVDTLQKPMAFPYKLVAVAQIPIGVFTIEVKGWVSDVELNSLTKQNIQMIH